MNIAYKIKYLDGFRGEAVLFRVEPPLEGHEYVVVSAVDIKPPTGVETPSFMQDYYIPETYIFGADPDGHVTAWGELPGSFKGAMDIPRALAQAGYEIREAA